MNTATGKWLCRLPIILMAGVAAWQIYNAVFGTLMPWKGGGFGMFASADSPLTRRIVVTAWGERGEEYLVILKMEHSALPHILHEVRLSGCLAHPTDASFQQLAKAIRASHNKLTPIPRPEAGAKKPPAKPLQRLVVTLGDNRVKQDINIRKLQIDVKTFRLNTGDRKFEWVNIHSASLASL